MADLLILPRSSWISFFQSRWTLSYIFTAVAFASSAWPLAATRAQDAAGQDLKVTEQAQPGAIHIAYEAPKNPEHQKVYELMKERHALETLQNIFSPFRLPVGLNIKTVGCDGVSNAWYQRVARQPTVSLCYEYLQEIQQGLPKETTPAGITPGDALVGQLFFAMAHEVGHAMFDIFDVPIFGRQDPTDAMRDEAQAMLDGLRLPEWGPWELESG